MWLLAAAHAMSFSEGQWLTGEPAAPWFGVSVAVAGDVLVVGNSPQGGEPWAYVFERRGGRWIQAGTIPGDPDAGQRPNVQVQAHASPTTLALFSWGTPHRVQVYARSGAGWARIPFEGGDALDVDVDGDRLAVVRADRVEVYERSGSSMELISVAVLGSNHRLRLPHDVDLDGDRLLVGLPPYQAALPGEANGVVAFRQGRGGWAREDAWTSVGDHVGYGHGVRWAGDAAVASWPFATAGDVRLGGIDIWAAGSRRPASLDGGPDGLGGPPMASTADSLAASDRFIVTGLAFAREEPIYGGVCVLEQSPSGWAVAGIRRAEDHPHFGFSVDLDGATLAVGAPRLDHREPGAVWVTTLSP